ncbi:MAG: hypothetical protein V3U55_03050 [Mycobacterium sp.]
MVCSVAFAFPVGQIRSGEHEMLTGAEAEKADGESALEEKGLPLTA